MHNEKDIKKHTRLICVCDSKLAELHKEMKNEKLLMVGKGSQEAVEAHTAKTAQRTKELEDLALKRKHEVENKVKLNFSAAQAKKNSEKGGSAS